MYNHVTSLYPLVETTVRAKLHLASSSCHICLSSALHRLSLSAFNFYPLCDVVPPIPFSVFLSFSSPVDGSLWYCFRNMPMRHAHTSQISVPSLWSSDLHEFPLPLCGSVPYLSIWDVVIVWDAKKSTVASHFISVVWILLSKSAVSVYDSQEYKNIDMTSERINLILQLSVTFPPVQIHLGIQFLPSRLLFAQLCRDFLWSLSFVWDHWSCWLSRVSSPTVCVWCHRFCW